MASNVAIEPTNWTNDTEDFVRLLTSHQPRLYAYIRALIPKRDDAEEVLQQTSVALWQNFDQFQPGTNFASWSLGVAHFRVLEFRKRQQRDRLWFSDAFVERVAHESTERHVQTDKGQALAQCLSKLRQLDRDLVQRRYRRGSTLKSTSTEVGRSVEALKKSLRRIRQTLFVCIERTLHTETRA